MKKKRTTTRKRTRKAASAAPRRRRRKSGGMSEMFTSATAHAGARVVGAGALGGLVAGAANRVLTKTNNVTRIGIELGAAFVTYAVLGYPNMSAGMAGAFAALESAPLYDKFLAEDEDDSGAMFADEDAINELPDLMNENGETLTLAENEYGQPIYLNESTGEVTLAESVYLQETAYLQEDTDQIYPDYSVQYS
jgi:hypothetical protein